MGSVFTEREWRDEATAAPAPSEEEQCGPTVMFLNDDDAYILTLFHRRFLWSLSPRGSGMSPKTLYATQSPDETNSAEREGEPEEGGRDGTGRVALQNEQNGAGGK